MARSPIVIAPSLLRSPRRGEGEGEGEGAAWGCAGSGCDMNVAEQWLAWEEGVWGAAWEGAAWAAAWGEAYRGCDMYVAEQ